MFNLTGTYQGYYVCDSTLDGIPSTWNEVINVSISEIEDPFLPSNRKAFFAELNYIAEEELGDQYTLYRGEYATSPSGDILSGYLNSCGATYPALELGRIFPSSTADPFGMTITSIWTSSEVPNLPGLFSQECKWSITRVDNNTPIHAKNCIADDGTEKEESESGGADDTANIHRLSSYAACNK